MITYTIIPQSVISQLIDYAIETNINTVRYSIDGTLAVLKYTKENAGYFSAYLSYTHNEILAELQTVNWNN